MRLSRNQKGQALVVVLIVLAILFVIGLVFFSLSQTERLAAVRHLDALKARYISEAGIVHARKVLELDKVLGPIDGLGDPMFADFAGNDEDLDADGLNESKWFYLKDSQQKSYGRYSVLVWDEAAKLNINHCEPAELENLLSAIGFADIAAGPLLAARPYQALQEISPFIKKDAFALLQKYLTVYSRDTETDLDGNRRVFINTAFTRKLLEAFLAAGVSSPFEKAASLIDARDSDLARTILYKFSLGSLMPSRMDDAGSWSRVDNFYQAPAGGAPGIFTWENLAVSDGEYFCFLHASSNDYPVGEVTFAKDGVKQTGQYMAAGDGLKGKVVVKNGSLTLKIKPSSSVLSRFSHIELASNDEIGGLGKKIVAGTESIVINEVMVKPSRYLSINPVSINSRDSFSHTFSAIKPGYYYLILKAATAGGFIGDLDFNGEKSDNVRDGDYFPKTVLVADDGNINMVIKNNSLGSSDFQGVVISQQPDAEYVEILNLSEDPIDMSGFYIEVYSLQGDMLPGWPARIPNGSVVNSYKHVCYAPDGNDVSPSPSRLCNNKVSFQQAWRFPVYSLIFEEAADNISKSFDLLPDKGGQIFLKDASGEVIDAVEYFPQQVSDFSSLERGDPSLNSDKDGNGFFDGWYASGADEGASPAMINENPGMYTRQTGQALAVKHSPSEIRIPSRKIESFADVKKLPGQRAWQNYALGDIAAMAERFSFGIKDLDLRGCYVSGEFAASGEIFESKDKGDLGVWEFTGIEKGVYLLSLISDGLQPEGAGITVATGNKDDSEFFFSPLLMFNKGIVLYGRAEVKSENSPFRIKIRNESGGRIGLAGISLEPLQNIYGRININTASQQLLRALLSDEYLLGRITQARAIGNSDMGRLGIGELILLDPGFLSRCQRFSVHSQTYMIDALGEYMVNNKPRSRQAVHTVIDRAQ